MVFIANNQQNDLTFDFNSTLIQTVNTHKHLGVILVVIVSGLSILIP
jgi:hypothetical protein